MLALGIKVVLPLLAVIVIVSVPPLPSVMPERFTVCGPGLTVGSRTLLIGSIVGGWLIGETVTVKVRLKVLTPPLAVPPLSITVTVIVAWPVALATGVKTSVAVVLGLV